MQTQHLLIGAGVAAIGYLLLKPKKEAEPYTGQTQAEIDAAAKAAADAIAQIELAKQGQTGTGSKGTGTGTGSGTGSTGTGTGTGTGSTLPPAPPPTPQEELDALVAMTGLDKHTDKLLDLLSRQLAMSIADTHDLRRDQQESLCGTFAACRCLLGEAMDCATVRDFYQKRQVLQDRIIDGIYTWEGGWHKWPEHEMGNLMREIYISAAGIAGAMSESARKLVPFETEPPKGVALWELLWKDVVSYAGSFGWRKGPLDNVGNLPPSFVKGTEVSGYRSFLLGARVWWGGEWVAA